MGGRLAASGIPGPRADASPGVVPSPEQIRQTESTDYGVSRTIRQTVQPKGTIRRLTVAVVLDNKKVAKKNSDGTETFLTEPRSPEEMDQCRDLVQAAVGFNQERGDVVTIKNMPFPSEAKPQKKIPATPWYTKWQKQSYMAPGLKYAAFIILFIIAYMVLLRPMRKRVFQALSDVSPALVAAGEAQLPLHGEARALKDGARPKAAQLGAAPPGQIDNQPAATAAGVPERDAQLPGETVSLEKISDEQIERELIQEASVMEMGNRKYMAMKKKLSEKARKDPEMISQLIRTLLHEKA